ncbi:EAL domain-containing protein [Sporosarcina sp. 179-K 8C2 HS]|uniref:putative bifunctional diguanylate cyclase/phosphodiesterase n=1 Tax=Sporosarcina sp. 179-K 8C2 HS TaxID=3142387 RepID=UPI0039A398FF
MKRVISKLLRFSSISTSAQPNNKTSKPRIDSNDNSNKKLHIEKELALAIENEDFDIYYQPQVNTEGMIFGAEALLRWNHHEWGFVSPGEFIPIAEETHLINRISDWVINKVCRQVSNWEEKGLTVQSVSVNISPVRLMEKGLVEFVTRQLEIYNIPATYLEFEITEHSLLKFDKSVLSTIKQLKELGVRIAIDDFGTGYSSIEYLREFHADTLKIDQVFIQNMSTTNEKDKVIVSSILHLAKGLDMRIVAEGVEDTISFIF